MYVVYLAHPLSAPTREGIEANRRNAALWAVWIEKTFGVAVSADWIWATGVREETPENRAHGLERDLARVERCDFFWLVGGRVSSGMTLELAHALRHRKPVLALTWFGHETPYPGSDREAELIACAHEWFRALARAVPDPAPHPFVQDAGGEA